MDYTHIDSDDIFDFSFQSDWNAPSTDEPQRCEKKTLYIKDIFYNFSKIEDAVKLLNDFSLSKKQHLCK